MAYQTRLIEGLLSLKKMQLSLKNVRERLMKALVAEFRSLWSANPSTTDPEAPFGLVTLAPSGTEGGAPEPGQDTVRCAGLVGGLDDTGRLERVSASYDTIGKSSATTIDYQ